jgi:hypothetical protein
MALITTEKKVLLPYNTAHCGINRSCCRKRTAIAELHQILFGPIKGGLDGISLANWMWAVKEGEDARLYAAVQSCSNFAIGRE